MEELASELKLLTKGSFNSSIRSSDDYDKIKVIGKGGSSIVYKGLIKATSQIIAIKEVTPTIT